MDDMTHSSSRVKAVYALWNEWALSFGVITACVLLSGYLIPKAVMPVVVLILAWLSGAYAASANRRTRLVCARLSNIVSKVLFITALVQIVCLAAVHIPCIQKQIGLTGYNAAIPYITSLIIYPVCAVISLLALIGGNKRNYCRRCRLLRGHGSECDLLGSVFSTVAHRQIRILFCISAGISVIVWGYYLAFYLNTNINTPDKFFYFFVPAAAYVVSLIYVGTVYHQFITEIRDYYNRHGNGSARGSELRFIVFDGDRILLSSESGSNECTDTPAKEMMPFSEHPDDAAAAKIFASLSAIKGNFDVRYLYTSTLIMGVSNVFHFAVVLDSDKPQPTDWKLGQNWVTLDQFDRLLKSGTICKPLAAEIHRIFTVTMAWKTYDRDGRRLYPIKNYHPTFRLRDFKEWDVDYGDPRWMDIAADNQDKPFYRMRQLVRKFTGIR